MAKYVLIFILILIELSCKIKDTQTPTLSNHEIPKVITRMTDIMVHDITNPPLAARFFSYACLSGYEVLAQNDTTFQSMHGVLNEFPIIEKPIFLHESKYFTSKLSNILPEGCIFLAVSSIAKTAANSCENAPPILGFSIVGYSFKMPFIE